MLKSKWLVMPGWARFLCHQKSLNKRCLSLMSPARDRMRDVMRFRTLGTVVKLGSCVWLLSSQTGLSAPLVGKVFTEVYKDAYRGNPAATKCLVCHQKDRGNSALNRYGSVLSEFLTAGSAVEKSVIAQSLRAAEDRASAIEGRSYGDLIKAGRLPNEGDVNQSPLADSVTPLRMR